MLNNKVTLYVPSTVNVVGDVHPDFLASVVQSVMLLFGLRFGGFTVTKAQGGWVSDTFGLIIEEVTLVSSHCDNERFMGGIESAINKAKEVSALMGQECVSLEVNGALYFISQGTYTSDVMNAITARIKVA